MNLRHFVSASGFFLTCAVSTAALAQDAGAIDLTGTWAFAITTSAELSAPILGTSPSPAEMAMRMHITENDGQLRAQIDVCRLSTDSTVVRVNYTPILSHLTRIVDLPAFTPAVGSEVPIPEVMFQVGQDDAGNAIDDDGDQHPGITLPVNALGAIDLDAYAGFVVRSGLSLVLTDEDTLRGTLEFSAVGQMFGSSNPLLTAGELRVTPTGAAPTLTAKHFRGDVPCEQAMSQL